MPTRELPILGPMTRPDTGGDVFFEPYSIKDTGAVIDPMVLIFNNTSVKDGIRGVFQVPKNYVDTAKLSIYWNANAATGAVVYDLSYLTRATGEGMGAVPTDTTDSVTTTTNGTAFNLNKSTMTLTSANFEIADIVLFELFRNGANASDTLAQPAIVFNVSFEYSDA